MEGSKGILLILASYSGQLATIFGYPFPQLAAWPGISVCFYDNKLEERRRSGLL